MKKLCFYTLVGLLTISLHAQRFSRQDSLRGSITPERVWWDLKHYDMSVEVFPSERKIKGVNTMTYLVIDPQSVMQIDLQDPMKLEKVIQEGQELSVRNEGNAHFITLDKKQKKGKEYKITMIFSGTPRIARNPPWDGGFTWKQDQNGNAFIATSNQGIGASIWWPNKDHPYDEPDHGVDLTITAPRELVAVGNGRLIKTSENERTKSWHWRVVNPINNYGVNINLGDYVHFSEIYKGLSGDLDMDYWVLKENLEKAKEQFKQAPMMMEAFEHWFGPYPFYEDSFKLVEVPYLGMEHQSSVTYGNKYQNGYLGRDLSGSSWGLKFDFILIHEAGHEWFANNITDRDTADMWIHEGFTAYSENLYLDYHFGKKASSEYVIGSRSEIANLQPMIGQYNVNQQGGGDIYNKGANILHTLRQLFDDDEKWRHTLIGLNTNFRHQTVTSKQVEDFIANQKGEDLTAFWDQYLRTTQIPTLNYLIDGNELTFRYTDVLTPFDMPLIMNINGKEEWIFPTVDWKTVSFDMPIKSALLKPDFYVIPNEINN
jgi:aminopeptidase N